MLRTFLTMLAQPYQMNVAFRHALKVDLIIAGFVGLFLGFFQPFNINTLEGWLPWVAAGAFAGVTLICELILLPIPYLLPQVFNEDRWTFGMELMWGLAHFLTVAHGNYLFMESGWLFEYQFMNYSDMVIGTFSVGFMPYVFIIATTYNVRLRANKGEAEVLTRELHPEVVAPSAQITVRLVGENEGDVLDVQLSDLLYLQSAANYVEVVHRNGGRIQKTLLRATISGIEEKLSAHPAIFRCHRTYLVNLDHVVRVAGNSQGYRLVMPEGLGEIPVARTKNADFRQVVGALHPNLPT